MQFTLTISQTKALEWGLNAQQALLFSFVYECPSWANPVITKDGVFFALSKAKIVEELPLLTDKPDTAYRLLKQLEIAGVIDLSHTPSITLIRITEKGREWNRAIDGSEKFPRQVGKKSEPGSEKFPTNQDTNNQDTNNQVKGSADDGEQDELFDRFWKLYPNKKAKVAARKAWAKLKVTEPLFSEILDGLALYCSSPEWLKDGGLYIPHPSTWLNGRRWEDDISRPAAGPQRQRGIPGSWRDEFDDSDNDLSWMEQLRR